MTFRQLIRRSLRFHARTHLGVLLGAAVAAAVLIGALAVGDSVRTSLREMALQRLGQTAFTIHTGDRYFSTNLLAHLNEQAGQFEAAAVDGATAWHSWQALHSTNRAAVALEIPATVSRQDGSARANRIQLFGVAPEFFELAQGSESRQAVSLAADSVWLNEGLAQQLVAKPGDTLVLRFAKPTALSRDAILTAKNDATVALRVTVASVLSGTAGGNFALTASQLAPLNAFLGYRTLAKAAGMSGRANLLIGAEVRPMPSDRLTPILPAAPVGEADRHLGSLLARSWSLADAELAVTNLAPPAALTGGEAVPPFIELNTRRIFLDPAAASAALTNLESQISNPESAISPAPLLTYLVNGLRAGDRLAPYSLVTAAGPPYTPADLADDEMLVNEWLAGDLDVKPGDRIELTYYVLDSATRLEERTNTFRIRAVVPLRGLHADRTLMPEFPGLAKAESTHDWDAGFELVHKIRDQDEAYWKQWRGTPKAFISLKAGQQMWGNRFGDLTAIRWFPARSAGSVPLPPSELHSVMEEQQQDIAAALRASLDPADFGLRFEPVRERALKAASSGQDFGGLFIGFSFFLIAAALLLTALLFQFSLEQRATEVGTLLALGWPPSRVRRLLLGEGAALAILGTSLGVAGGVLYAKGVLWGLRTIWRDAVAGSGLEFHVSPVTLVGGAMASILIAVGTLWLALRRQVKRPARELLAEGASERSFKLEGVGGRARRWLAPAVLAAALGMIGAALATGQAANPGLFFGAGALLLIGGLLWVRALLRGLLGRAGSFQLPIGAGTGPGQGRELEAPGTQRQPEAPGTFTLGSLGLRGAARRSKRSLATVALLACGSFLIVAVGANKLDALRDAAKRTSGTGGFALWGESALPVVEDLNTTKGREFFGLDDKALAGVSVVPMRVRAGDDASCLNLNRAQRPRLLGVKPELLAQRGAFTFKKLVAGRDLTNGWLVLNSELGTRNSELNEVPAIGDANSIQWALGKKLGDTLDYVDERGQPFKVRLVGAVANSILQGNLLIDEAEFTRRFPSEGGYRAFLIDVSEPDTAGTARQLEVAGTLSRALQDVGLELTPTTRRLAQFNAVQNTYLNTFQMLGGLGLLLGSVGLGIVVLRNVFERRGELAVMQAVGFRQESLSRLVLTEHGALLGLGLLVGVVAAVIAVLPALLSPGAEVPWLSLSLTLLAVLLNGALWTWLATRRALRGRLLDSLRNL